MRTAPLSKSLVPMGSPPVANVAVGRMVNTIATDNKIGQKLQDMTKCISLHVFHSITQKSTPTLRFLYLSKCAQHGPIRNNIMGDQQGPHCNQKTTETEDTSLTTYF